MLFWTLGFRLTVRKNFLFLHLPSCFLHEVHNTFHPVSLLSLSTTAEPTLLLEAQSSSLQVILTDNTEASYWATRHMPKTLRDSSLQLHTSPSPVLFFFFFFKLSTRGSWIQFSTMHKAFGTYYPRAVKLPSSPWWFAYVETSRQWSKSPIYYWMFLCRGFPSG